MSAPDEAIVSSFHVASDASRSGRRRAGLASRGCNLGLGLFVLAIVMLRPTCFACRVRRRSRRMRLLVASLFTAESDGVRH